MKITKTHYKELITEITDAEAKGLLKEREYTENELAVIDGIIENGGYTLEKATELVAEDCYILYQGITEMSDVAYDLYKSKKNGATQDIGRFGLEIMADIESYVDWSKWGESLKEEAKFLYTNQGIIMLLD